MIEQLLPHGVVAVEAFEDVPGDLSFPGEESFVLNAVESRRHEFITARRCARDALVRLGYAPARFLGHFGKRAPVRPGYAVPFRYPHSRYRRLAAARPPGASSHRLKPPLILAV